LGQSELYLAARWIVVLLQTDQLVGLTALDCESAVVANYYLATSWRYSTVLVVPSSSFLIDGESGEGGSDHAREEWKDVGSWHEAPLALFGECPVEL
jgi:hypothetical protein